MKGFFTLVLLIAAAFVAIAGEVPAMPHDAPRSSMAGSYGFSKQVPIASPTPPVEEAPESSRTNVRKRNERGSYEVAVDSATKEALSPESGSPIYHYEFSNPNYAIGRIRIKHDRNGNGTVGFIKRGEEEMLSESVQLSDATLERLYNLYTSLDFLNSNEVYQARRDYSHLGTITITVRAGDRHREVQFNWSDNKDAKALADEYRRIANQFVWIFDMNVARENQPLESPKLMNSLEALLRRNEISDPQQLVSFLRVVNDDERLPLIARNQAAKIITQLQRSRR
jgi:hypothetical protein